MKIRLKKNSKIALIAVAAIVVIGLGTFVGYKTFHKEETKPTNNSTGKKLPGNNEAVKPAVKIVDVNSNSRPYAVMINNINVARPYQTGLQDAYIIYEMLAEGGITRYMALFKDKDTAKIGTIRSSRHYYLDYALENDAIYVHFGWSDQAKSDIKNLGIDNIDGITNSSFAFWRDSEVKKTGIAKEHTVYTKMESLKEAVAKRKYRTETNQDLLFEYSPEEIDLSSMPNAVSATSIDINYSSSNKNHYDYDATTKTYKRSVNGRPHTDYVTKEQYTFKNIIVYQLEYSLIPGDKKNRQGLSNLGNGTGYFITDGYAVPIKWSKDKRANQTKYTFEDGKEITLNDGNCFIQLQPKGQTLNIN